MIVGKALYERRFTVAEALAALAGLTRPTQSSEPHSAAALAIAAHRSLP